MAVSEFKSLLQNVSVSVPAGATPSSDVVDLHGCCAVAFEFPNMAGTAITFLKELADGVTYSELKDESGNARSVSVPTGGGVVSLDDPVKMISLRRFKIKSNGTETAAKTIVINARPL